MGVQTGASMTHQPMASLHKVTRFLLEPSDHLGIITAVSTALKGLLREPKDVTAKIRVVLRMVQHLQEHSVLRVCSVSSAATTAWKRALACDRRRPRQRSGTHSLGGSTNVSEGPTFALCVDGP